MAVIGKGTTSFRKKDVAEQKGIALGFKKVRFAHKATAGDTGINLSSLVTPTEMSTYGFVNPSASTIAAAQLNFFRNNLKLVSSLKGLLVDQLSYQVVSSTQINFIDFTAEDGEIFTGWLDEAPTTSLNVVDGRTIIASGTLTAGSTDFNIGTPIVINQNSAQQIGAVMVFADRALQYRKVGNVTGGDGDYIEVPVAGGLGSLIRFSAQNYDRFITVISNGVVAERPDGSMMAAIERAQGQIDAMVPTLAAVAGVPTTTFQTAPNNVDLKQFGDQVVSNTASIAAQAVQIASIGQKPSIQLYRNGAFSFSVGSNAFSWDAANFANKITWSSGSNITFNETGLYMATVSYRSINDVWTKWYTVDSLNSVLGESEWGGSGQNWPAQRQWLFRVTAAGTLRIIAHVDAADNVVAPAPGQPFFGSSTKSLQINIFKVSDL